MARECLANGDYSCTCEPGSIKERACQGAAAEALEAISRVRGRKVTYVKTIEMRAGGQRANGFSQYGRRR